MKQIGFFILIFVLFASLFKLWGADLNNNVLGIALMILLLSLFSDLKRFSFWGLVGEKEAKNIKNLIGQDGVKDETPGPDKNDLQQAQEQPIQLMENAQGNFLALAFEIERLLRLAATIILGKDVPPNATPKKIASMLTEKGLLTEIGEKQVETIRWLRNMLVHGRQTEVATVTLDSGTEIAWSLYNELLNWVNNPK